MAWARILAYVTGTVDQELLARSDKRGFCKRRSGVQIPHPAPFPDGSSPKGKHWGKQPPLPGIAMAIAPPNRRRLTRIVFDRSRVYPSLLTSQNGGSSCTLEGEDCFCSYALIERAHGKGKVTISIWKFSLSRAVQSQPNHFTRLCYAFAIPDKNPLETRIANYERGIPTDLHDSRHL